MDPSELLILLVLPMVIAVLAAVLNNTRSLAYWAVASALAFVPSVGLFLFSLGSTADPMQSGAGTTVFLLLPAFVTFIVARRRAFRDRRTVAAMAAFCSYEATMLIAVVFAVNTGLLRP